MNGFKIDFTETFPHFNNAPIVEAVVSIHARPEKRLDEKELSDFLKAKLQDYPHVVSQKENSVTFQILGDGKPPSAGQNIVWRGVQLQSAENLQIAQFNRDGFVFSRLSPYKEWAHLSGETFRLFNLFVEIARPKEVQRLGLRFVNRFQMPPGENQFEHYIKPYPETPIGLDLPFSGFFHQDSFAIPGLPYGINLVRTIQPPTPPMCPGVGIIIDSDVFTVAPFEFDFERIKRHLDDMRWLKNKVFFGSITNKSIELFQ